AVLGGTLQIVGRKMIGPDLGGQEHLVAPRAGGAQPLTYLALILVNLRRIDMTVAKLERLLHDPGAGSAAELPGAEPDRWNFRAISLDELHGGNSVATRAPIPKFASYWATSDANFGI